ncbi:hypothetical protein [Actinoplanes sp. NPDC048796]|uniref:hypothetical protein n=1 Tax=Actinoplanes sp. NPDC048796 TaxID=3155640 RepID=UPI0033CD453D
MFIETLFIATRPVDLDGPVALPSGLATSAVDVLRFNPHNAPPAQREEALMARSELWESSVATVSRRVRADGPRRRQGLSLGQGRKQRPWRLFPATRERVARATGDWCS